MAIAIEGTPSYGNTAATSYTAETTGSDRLLVIAVSCEDNGTPDITGLTFGGVTCTQAVTRRSGGTSGPYQNASIYYLKQADIPSGAQTPSATFDSDPITTGPIFDYITLSGVDQTTPVDSSSSDSRDNSAGTTFATGVSLNPTSSGGLAVAVLSHGSSSGVAVSGFGSWTERADTGFGSAYWRWLGTLATTGSTEALNPTFTSVSFVAIAAAAFKPASGAAVVKLKLLTHSSAASATSVAGAVFAAPTGGNITGSKIGEFTGKSFEASLESGQAVLKVPVADFGGEALTTSDTPVAIARNTTYTTGIVSCTVIEE